MRCPMSVCLNDQEESGEFPEPTVRKVSFLFSASGSVTGWTGKQLDDSDGARQCCGIYKLGSGAEADRAET